MAGGVKNYARICTEENETSATRHWEAVWTRERTSCQVTNCQFRQFQAGQLSLTGWERLALARRLNVSPEIFQDLAAGCTETEFQEYETWLETRSKWRSK